MGLTSFEAEDAGVLLLLLVLRACVAAINIKLTTRTDTKRVEVRVEDRIRRWPRSSGEKHRITSRPF
jgi:hypothetical protein